MDNWVRCRNMDRCLRLTLLGLVVLTSAWFVSGQTCLPCMAENQFQCNNCRCISQRKKCDHNNDCGDNSDELSNCTYTPCSGAEFTCKNKRCMKQNYICDGSDDCGDGSDEERCGNYSCHPHEWPCPDSGRCIPIEKVCDLHTDCSSRGDEGPGCQISCQQMACNHACRPTPTGGGVCYCKVGYMLNPADNYTCIDFDECSTWGFCDQICKNIPGSFQCSCQDGYTLEGNRTCTSTNSSSMRILASTGTSIIRMDRDGQDQTVLVSVAAQDFDVDLQGKLLFFINKTDKQVYKTTLDGNSKSEILPLKGLALPVGLAWDWLGGNLYVADQDSARIDLYSLSTGFQRNILSDNIQSPTCIALDPTTGYLFFADLGNSSPGNVPRIERTFMDGSNRWNLKITKILNPQGLTVDSINHRLFWVDSHLDHLETVDYDGLNRWAVRKVKRCVWIKRNRSSINDSW